jgi:cysteine synthase A
MPLLFSYGTLQQDEVQRATFGRLLHGERDELPGFEPSLVPIEDPGVVATSGRTHHANVTFNGRPDSRVPGVVFEITDAELADADRYEQEARYTRVAATLASGRQAWVYLEARSAGGRAVSVRPLGKVLEAIGNTPLVELVRVVPAGRARVVVKLESANPTGSMKDRLARALIERAAADGRLPPGGTVVEYTAGTTGISLAFVCAALGYRAHLVFSDAFSDEKRRTMRTYGATITEVPSDHRRITESLIKAMIRTARDIAGQAGHWWCDQLNNRDGEAGYHPLGEELWRQAGRVDAFVHVVSTAHSIHGTAHALRRHRPALRVVAVEPAESAVLSGKPSGSHRIEGIGIGFTPPLWRRHEVDEILTVTTDEAHEMARRLAREEGIFAGPSTGANVVAARRVAMRLDPAATVATIVVDSGSRYLSAGVFPD